MYVCMYLYKYTTIFMYLKPSIAQQKTATIKNNVSNNNNCDEMHYYYQQKYITKEWLENEMAVEHTSEQESERETERERERNR